MSVISALFIGKIADAAASEGLNRANLVASCGIGPHEPIDPAHMVSEEDHYILWERIMAQLDSPGFPIRYASTVKADDYGAFGLAVKTAPTLRDALHRAHRYLIVMTSTSWLDISEAENHGRTVFRREGARRLGMRCANEAALAELVGTTREICGIQYKPKYIRYRHPAPRDVSEHERFFGCPILFEQEVDCLEVETSLLELPLPKADSGLSKFLLDHLDSLVQKSGAELSLDQSLRGLISDGLPDGAPNMHAIAKRLGMSRRTLARRLAATGTSFQQLVEDTRREVAQQLLQQTQHSLAEVGFLLGFSEQSAFQRAFKRWTNQTPAEFRSIV